MLNMQQKKINKKEIWLIISIFLLAFFMRVTLLDLRPLHHDESVNEYFLSNLINNNNYKYNPDNYHGPFLYYVSLPFTLLKTTEITLRLSEVLFGSALCILPFFIKPFSKKARLLSCVFLIISPSLFYYSRYAIHETFFVFFTLLALVSLINLTTKNTKKIWIYLFVLSLFLSYANKETAIINCFCIFVILVVMLFSRERRLNIKENLFEKKNGKSYLTKHLFFAIGIGLLVHIALFSSFFTYPKGVIDSVIGPFNWKTRTNEHSKPIYYFAEILLKFELPILLISLTSIIYYAHQLIKKEKPEYETYISLFGFLLLIIYSLISYKTPWLILSASCTLCLTAGIFLSKIENKNLLITLIAVCAIYLIYQMIITSFIYPANDEKNPFSYVHTDINLKKNINAIISENDKIEIVGESADYWPLPFYLKGRISAYNSVEGFLNALESSENKNLLVREADFEKIEETININYTVARQENLTIRSGSSYIFLELKKS